MRKLYLAFVISAFTCISAQAQDEILLQFSHNYFRSDPFQGQFSSFIQHLVSDPGITEKDFNKRTDTSLFYFLGVYKNYNPFFFKPKRVQIQLEEAVIRYNDSLHVQDTILVYQLMAYNDDTKDGRQELKKEFDKINRKYGKKFYDHKYDDLKSDDYVIGGIHHYFVAWHGLAPVSVLWQEDKEKKEVILSLTIRMKTSNNYATLPAPLYKTK